MERTRQGRRWSLVGLMILAVIPSLLTLDSIAGLVAGWRPESEADWTVLVCSLVGLALVLLGPRLAPIADLSRHPLRAFVLVAACSGFALVSDYLLRCWNPPPGTGALHLDAPFAHWPVKPKAATGEKPAEVGYFTVNSQGVRAADWPSRKSAHRILVVGGTLARSSNLSDEQTWTHLLMEKLNQPGDSRVWIGSAGQDGYTTAEHLRFISESPLLNEVDCVAIVCGWDDLAAAFGENTAATALPHWRRSRLFDLFFDQNSASPRNRAVSIPKDIDSTMLNQFVATFESRIRQILLAAKQRNVDVVMLTHPDLDQPAMNRINSVVARLCTEESVACVDLATHLRNPANFAGGANLSSRGARSTAAAVSKWFAERGIARETVESGAKIIR